MMGPNVKFTEPNLNFWTVTSAICITARLKFELHGSRNAPSDEVFETVTREVNEAFTAYWISLLEPDKFEEPWRYGLRQSLAIAQFAADFLKGCQP